MVFHEMRISTKTLGVILKEWMKDCKIDKHIIYHCSYDTGLLRRCGILLGKQGPIRIKQLPLFSIGTAAVLINCRPLF